MSKINKEQIDLLKERQQNDLLHPFTCCSPSDIPECKRKLSYKLRWDGNKDIPYSDENEGILIPTEDGWVCPCGKYKQEYRNEIK